MGTETGGEGGRWGGGHFPGTPGPSSWRPVAASKPVQQHEDCDDQEVEDELRHLHHRQHRGAKPQAPLAAQVGQEADHLPRERSTRTLTKPAPFAPGSKMGLPTMQGQLLLIMPHRKMVMRPAETGVHLRGLFPAVCHTSHYQTSHPRSLL